MKVATLLLALALACPGMADDEETPRVALIPAHSQWVRDATLTRGGYWIHEQARFFTVCTAETDFGPVYTLTEVTLEEFLCAAQTDYESGYYAGTCE